MRLISPQFREALCNGPEVFCRAEVYRQNEKLMDVELLSGSITDDKFAAIRRRCTVALRPDSSIIPAADAKYDRGLWPVGTELRLYQGLRYGTQYLSEELALGPYRIGRPSLAYDGTSVSLQVEGYDRSRTVSRARFTDTYVIKRGADYGVAIHDLVHSRVPWLDYDADFDFMDTRTILEDDGSYQWFTPGITFDAQDDPWEKATEMAASIGAELFFRPDPTAPSGAKCVLRLEPEVTHEEPVFRYTDQEDCILTGITRDLDDESAYNGVIVVAEDTDLPRPLRAEAWDTNPASPTYYDPDYPHLSTFGAVPYFMTTRYATKQSQVDRAAKGNLEKRVGILENVQFTSIANFAHESGDVIQIERPEINVTGVFVLDVFSHTLGPECTASGATRLRST